MQRSEYKKESTQEQRDKRKAYRDANKEKISQQRKENYKKKKLMLSKSKEWKS